MSARIAPEPVSVGVTLANEYAPRTDRSTRPVEPAATPADNKEGTSLGRRPRRGDAPQLPARPPGQDPSVAPQSLFDAALIASENKPTFDPVEVPTPEELEAQAANDDRPSKSTTPTVAASDTPAAPDVAEVAEPDVETEAKAASEPTSEADTADNPESESSED
jgi:hypothetical protein